MIVGYLIGQLGKNDKYSNLITGHTILIYAYNTIYECFKLAGSRLIFIECENKKELISFYEHNNFKYIGTNDKNGLLQFVRTVVRIKQPISMIEK